MKLSIIVLYLIQGSFVAPQFMDIKKICVDRGVCNNNHALNTSLCNACLREFEIYNDMYNKAKNLKPGDSDWAPTSVSKYAVDTPTSTPAAASPALQGNPQALTTAAAPTPPAAPVLPAASIPLAVPAINPTPAVTAPATPAPINPVPASQLPVLPATAPLPATVPVAAPLQTGSVGPKLGGQSASGAAASGKDSAASPSQTDIIVPTFLPTSTSAPETNSTAPTSSESASASSDSRISAQLTSVLSITAILVLFGISIGL